MSGATAPSRAFRLACAGSEPAAERCARAAGNVPGLEIVSIDEAEAVCVAHAPLERAAAALECLRAGKHVLLEAPVADDWPALDLLVAESAARGLRLTPLLPYRFQPACAAIREQVQLMPWGFPSSVEIALGRDDADARSLGLSGNGALGTAAHLLDLVRWTLGTEPQSVEPIQAAGAVRALKIELGHMASGVQVCWLADAPAWGWRIVFRGGDKELVLERPLPAADAELWVPLLADFAAACREGREPEVNTADALSGVGVARAAAVAWRSGKRAEIVRHHYEHDLDAKWERENRKPARA
ncbi:MAG: Gfo/Idh/MocA family oxidoreductase [Planctomycetes bacterium]|nr:Gfo/Idh/MocA family oxidoreductase [Planctomycetota bacterium]